jgi:hypothetical protein
MPNDLSSRLQWLLREAARTVAASCLSVARAQEARDRLRRQAQQWAERRKRFRTP